MLCNASVHFYSLVIKESPGFCWAQTSGCSHIATWNFLVSSSIVDISERIRSKNGNCFLRHVRGWEVPTQEGLLNCSTSAFLSESKFTSPVMENISFCKISRSVCLPNLSPEDRDIPFTSAFLLRTSDDGQVPKPSVTYRRQNQLFWTRETSKFPYRFCLTGFEYLTFQPL
jgi:hypothetical protein